MDRALPTLTPALVETIPSQDPLLLKLHALFTLKIPKTIPCYAAHTRLGQPCPAKKQCNRHHFVSSTLPPCKLITHSPKSGSCHNYLRWNITISSSNKSLKSNSFPFFMTSGCFLTISHPTCEKKNPLLALCGSPLVSAYLWWTRWSLTHSKMSFCPAVQLINIRNNLRGQTAL